VVSAVYDAAAAVRRGDLDRLLAQLTWIEQARVTHARHPIGILPTEILPIGILSICILPIGILLIIILSS
jgi:hypothetical protein